MNKNTPESLQQVLHQITSNTNATKSSTGWTGHCPAHDDKNPSLSIKQSEDGKILLHCHAGCTIQSILEELGLDMSDLFMNSQKNNMKKCTVEELALLKKLPVDYLKSMGLKNCEKGVEIEYKELNGNIAKRNRIRTYLNSAKKSLWSPGSGDILPYGLWKLEEAVNQGYLIIVEGETDCLTLWFHEFPALGIPGATMIKTLDSCDLNGISKIYVVNEKDDAGEKFIKGVSLKIKKKGWQGDLFEMILAECKDPSELHIIDPERFKQTFNDELSRSKKITHQVEDEIVSIEDPKPLMREYDKPCDFPISALGPDLEALATVIHSSIQAPLAIIGNSLLASLSLTVQKHRDIKIDGRIFPISEYFLTIGSSGERKSAVDSIVLFIHKFIQKEMMTAYNTKITEWEEACAEAAENKSPKPPKPIKPIFLLDEPTYEGLFKLLMIGCPSVGIFSDEGGRFICGHAMNNENQIKTAAGFSELWDGKPISRIRASEEPTVLYGRRASLHLMVQPRSAKEFLENEGLSDQGLFSRMLIVYPETTCGTRFYKNINIQETKEFVDYCDKIIHIYQKETIYFVDEKKQLHLPFISLTEEAKEEWIRFHDAVEVQLGEHGELAPIRAFANKAAEHALRLAAILTLYHDIDAEWIELEYVKRGILLATFYLVEALRISQMGVEYKYLELASTVEKYFLRNNIQKITLVDLYQYGPSKIRSAYIAQKVMTILEEHNRCVSIPEGAIDRKGKRRSVAWRIIHG